MRKTDLAWAAGFIDGEGCLSFCPNPQLSASQFNLEPLEELQLLFGGNITPPKSNGVSQWYVGAHKAVNVARLILPYLKAKDNQARLFIEWEELQKLKTSYWVTPELKEARIKLSSSMRELNSRR